MAERDDANSASAEATNTRAPGYTVQRHDGDVEARIEAIADCMRACQWRRGKSGAEFAANWGLSEQRVREIAAEASKRVRAEFEDPDRAVVNVYATLETVMLDGASSSVPGEKAAAVQAARLMAELSGMGKQNEPKEPAGPVRFIVETVSSERPKPDPEPTE